MFESLSEKLSGVFKSLRAKGRLSEKDLEVALREVRLALLEADVHYKVAKGFVAAVQTRALGQEVMKSLTPGQMVIKVVREELVGMMGIISPPWNCAAVPPCRFSSSGFRARERPPALGNSRPI